MHTLERIYLQGEDYHFTDVGLAALANLTELRVLVLNHGSTNFTDTGLIHLRTLTNLEHLEVQGPGITDEGIQHLSTLQNLRTVWITGSKVTPAGLRAVQARLPKTRFDVHPRNTDERGSSLAPTAPINGVRESQRGLAG